MRPWASWTAKTAVLTLTAGLAATARRLSGVALAPAAGAALAAGRGGGRRPGRRAGDVCSDAGALLGIVGAACRNVPLGRLARGRRGQGVRHRGVRGRRPTPAAGPAKAARDGPGQPGRRRDRQPGGPAGRGPGHRGARSHRGGRAGAQDGARAGPAHRRDRRPVDVPDRRGGRRVRAGVRRHLCTRARHRAGDTNVPAATQLAGLGALPGLADLPSRPVWPARPPGTGPWAAAIPYPGPRCRRPPRA